MKKLFFVLITLLPVSAFAANVQDFSGRYDANTTSNYTLAVILASDMSAKIESVVYPIECNDCKKKISLITGKWTLQNNQVIIIFDKENRYIFNITDEKTLSLENANLSPKDKMFSFKFKKI